MADTIITRNNVIDLDSRRHPDERQNIDCRRIADACEDIAAECRRIADACEATAAPR